MELSRRELLLKTLFGGGLLGLRSLATGIPLSFLLNPRRALADTAPSALPQYLILSTSGNGDPVNANVPGTYADSGIVHSTDSSMQMTNLTLAGTQTAAAAPWASLPQAVLDRTCFFHHGTYTVIHPDEQNVLRLMQETTAQEMFPSIIAKQTGPQLGTIQTQPVALGSFPIDFDGSPQPLLAPSALKETLLAPSGVIGKLQGLRDKYVDEINAYARTEGNSYQRAFIDKYVLSQRQAREISQSLLTTLSTIKDNAQDSQMTAAVVLIQMNVAPVITMNINFGSDNHVDPGLATETAATVAGVATIENLMTQLAAAGLQDRVTFMSLNVFGRTLATTGGRTHLGNHHCTVLIGAPFQGGVIGGVEPYEQDYRAMSIDSQTGAGVPTGGGDVAFGNTLTSMAKTAGLGLGVDADYLDQNILAGTVIQPALAGS